MRKFEGKFGRPYNVIRISIFSKSHASDNLPFSEADFGKEFSQPSELGNLTSSHVAHCCAIFLCHLGCEIQMIDTNNRNHLVGQLTNSIPHVCENQVRTSEASLHLTEKTHLIQYCVKGDLFAKNWVSDMKSSCC